MSAGASIEGNVQAARVYLVMTSAGNVPRTGHVLLDGKPIPASEAGQDVHDGSFTVQGQRLYSLVSLPSAQQHTVTVVGPARRERLRLHVRIAAAALMGARAAHAVEHRGGRQQVLGRVDVEQQSRASGPRSRPGSIAATASRTATPSNAGRRSSAAARGW